MPTLPKILARRRHADHSFLASEELDLEFANGARRTYERILNAGHGAALIVPVVEGDTILMIREYAAGLNHYELGLPKGRLEAGEDVLEGANRELKEEAGVGARKLTRLGRVALAPAYMSHVIDVVLAQDLYPERLPGDEPEEMETVHWKLSDLAALMARPDVTAARTLAALTLAREYLAGRYRPAC